MKKLLLAATALGIASFCLQDVSTGHGGTYRGPGDTVPPGGGGGGGGAGPATPGPSTPGSPGPAGPTTPGPAAPSTPGQAPSGRPKGPSTGGDIDVGPDLTVWSFWWEFNKDPYLNLKAAIHSDTTTTGSDDFFLGFGEKDQARDSLAPTQAQIRQTVVPALLEVLEKETNNDIVTGALIALAKIGDAKDESGASQFQQVIEGFLDDSNQEIAETAAVCLGILANPASIPVLQDLVRDNAEGRKRVGANEVSYRTRAFAAYGLALIGYQLTDDQEDSRREIVKTLVEVIRSDSSSTRDIQVACLTAVGLVPLGTVDVPPNEDGTPVDPWASRMAQIDFLVAYFQDENNHFNNRAHAPTAVARLLTSEKAPLEPTIVETIKARVAPLFMEPLGKRAKAEKEIQQSCVIALGMIGDNDGDDLDGEIRKTLQEALEISDQQTRNFSMIASAHAAGHVGLGEDVGVGTKELQKHLLKSLSKGKSTLRPWAGLGLGVLGNMLDANGDVVPGELAGALRDALAEEKTPDRVGAYAIGVGMLRDQDSRETLMGKLAELRDDEARGYTAVALGMMNAKEAIEPIQAIVRESKYRPELLQQAAIALGLLGDKQLVDDLVEMLRSAKGLATQAALASALGFIGDSRSIDPLVDMLKNKEITDTARGFAAVALGIVADKEPLPWNSKIAVDIHYRASTVTLNDPAGTGILNIL